MYNLLLIILLVDCLALMIVVLLQSGKGGGLAAGFGGSGTGMEMMGSRQTATFLHNATRWLGGAFLVVCFAISLMTVRGTAPRSLIESEMQDQAPSPTEEQPATGAPADLQSVLEEEPAPPAGPAAPPAGTGGAPPPEQP